MTVGNSDSREEKLSRDYDLVIIGGGFHGACAFEEAVARGVNVLLLERGDFCSGASANSLKTVQGDIRRLRLMARARQLWALRAPRSLRPGGLDIYTVFRGNKILAGVGREFGRQ